MQELKKLREELQVKSSNLQDLFQQSKTTPDGSIDLSKVERFGDVSVKGKSSSELAVLIDNANNELTDLGKKIDELAAVQKAEDENAARLEKASQVSDRLPHPVSNISKHGESKSRLSLGEEVVNSKEYKSFLNHNTGSYNIKTSYGLPELKTLFQTSAGWAAESLRIGRLVDGVTRPISAIDVIPSGQTGSAAVVYMEETTRTHASAEKAAAAAFAESTFVLTERSETVRKITDSLPVTDEQLADVSGVQSYINSRLVFGCRQRLDGQVLVGDGSAPNLTGLVNKSGISTQAKGSDSIPDAVYKAKVKVAVTGRSNPNVYFVHPNDWQQVRLLTTSDGVYIWGSPSEAGLERIWGLQVVQSDALTENTAGVVDTQFLQIFEREGVNVQIGYVDDDFTKGKQTLRATLRVAFAIYRAAAVCTVTSI